MPTSYDTDLHFLAKKAKNRLATRNDNDNTNYNKYIQRENDIYSMILEMATEEQTVYNPISRFIGKDLKKVPDSSEKIRTVLETSRQVNDIKQRVKSDLIKKERNHEQVIIDGKEYDPSDLLRKLH